MLTLAPFEVSAYLSYLGEYVQLNGVFREYAHKKSLPPLKDRERLKWFEEHIPPNLLKFLNLMSKYPHLACRHNWPMLTHCPHCAATLYVEWFLEFSTAPCIITCGNCDTIFAIGVEGLKERFCPRTPSYQPPIY